MRREAQDRSRSAASSSSRTLETTICGVQIAAVKRYIDAAIIPGMWVVPIEAHVVLTFMKTNISLTYQLVYSLYYL